MKKTCKDLHIQVEEGIIRPAAGKSRILYGGLRMYKLLLVSDREDVLNAFDQIQNWERQGFKPPHIRHDFEGTKDSLAKHHADGISIAVAPEEEKKILAYLQEFFPNVPIFQAHPKFIPVIVVIVDSPHKLTFGGGCLPRLGHPLFKIFNLWLKYLKAFSQMFHRILRSIRFRSIPRLTVNLHYWRDLNTTFTKTLVR